MRATRRSIRPSFPRRSNKSCNKSCNNQKPRYIRVSLARGCLNCLLLHSPLPKTGSSHALLPTTTQSRRLCWSRQTFALIIVALLAVTAAAEAAPQRIGFDPLSVEEQQLAREAALAAPSVAQLLEGIRRSELLLIERHEESKEVYNSNGAWPRRADVFIYNYAQDTLVRAVVDLSAGEVDSVEALQSFQLPFTANEAAVALGIALADGLAGELILDEYQRLVGTLLTPEAVEVSPIVLCRLDARWRRAGTGRVWVTPLRPIVAQRRRQSAECLAHR